MIHLNILLIKSFKLSNFLNTFDKINILIFIYLFYSILLSIRHISRFHFSQIIHNEENEEKISQTKQKKKKACFKCNTTLKSNHEEYTTHPFLRIRNSAQQAAKQSQ